MGETVSTMAEIIYEHENIDFKTVTEIILSSKKRQKEIMSVGKMERSNSYRSPDHVNSQLSNSDHLTSPCSKNHVSCTVSSDHNRINQGPVDHGTSQGSDNYVTSHFPESNAFANRKRSIEHESDIYFVKKMSRQCEPQSVLENPDTRKGPVEFHKFVDQQMNKNMETISPESYSDAERMFKQFMHREKTRENDFACGLHNINGKYCHLSEGSSCNCGCDSDSYLKKMLETSNMIAPCASCDTETGSTQKHFGSCPGNGQIHQRQSEDIYKAPRHSTPEDKPENMLASRDDYTRAHADKLNLFQEPVNSKQIQVPMGISHYQNEFKGDAPDRFMSRTNEGLRQTRQCPEHNGTSGGTVIDRSAHYLNGEGTMRKSVMTSPGHHNILGCASSHPVTVTDEKGPPPLIHMEETKNSNNCTCHGSRQNERSQSDDVVLSRPEQPLDLTLADEPLDLSLKATNLKVPPRRVSTSALRQSTQTESAWPTCSSAPVLKQLPERPRVTYKQPPPPPYPTPLCNGHCHTSSPSQPVKSPISHFMYSENQPMPQGTTLYHRNGQHLANQLSPCDLHGIGRGRVDSSMIAPDGSMPHPSPNVPGHLHAAYLMLAPKPFKRGRGRPRTPKSLKALEDALKVRYDLEDILCLVCNICAAYFTRVATLYSHFSKAHEVPLCMDYITVRTITEVRGAMRHHGLNNTDVQMMFAQLQVFNAGNLKGSPPLHQDVDKMPHPQTVANHNYGNGSTPCYNPYPQKVEYVNQASSPRRGTPVSRSPHNSRPASAVGPNTPPRLDRTPDNPNQSDISQEPIKTPEQLPDGKVKNSSDEGGAQNSALDYIGDIINYHFAETKQNVKKDGTSSPNPTKQHQEENQEDRHSTVEISSNEGDSQHSNGNEEFSPNDETDPNTNIVTEETKDTQMDDNTESNVSQNISLKDDDVDPDMRADPDEQSGASSAVINLDCVHECNNLKDGCSMNSDIGQLFGGRLCIDLDVR